MNTRQDLSNDNNMKEALLEDGENYPGFEEEKNDFYNESIDASSMESGALVNAQNERQVNVDDTKIILPVKGLELKKVTGNGTCLFDAVAAQIRLNANKLPENLSEREERTHENSENIEEPNHDSQELKPLEDVIEVLRNDVASYMENNENEFMNFYKGSKENNQDAHEKKIQAIREGNETGDDIEIMGIHLCTERPLIIFMMYDKPTTVPKMFDPSSQTAPPIFLTYDIDKNHYDSLIIDGSVPEISVLWDIYRKQIDGDDLSLTQTVTNQDLKHSDFKWIEKQYGAYGPIFLFHTLSACIKIYMFLSIALIADGVAYAVADERPFDARITYNVFFTIAGSVLLTELVVALVLSFHHHSNATAYTRFAVFYKQTVNLPLYFTGINKDPNLTMDAFFTPSIIVGINMLIATDGFLKNMSLNFKLYFMCLSLNYLYAVMAPQCLLNLCDGYRNFILLHLQKRAVSVSLQFLLISSLAWLALNSLGIDSLLSNIVFGFISLSIGLLESMREWEKFGLQAKYEGSKNYIWKFALVITRAFSFMALLPLCAKAWFGTNHNQTENIFMYLVMGIVGAFEGMLQANIHWSQKYSVYPSAVFKFFASSAFMLVAFCPKVENTPSVVNIIFSFTFATLLALYEFSKYADGNLMVLLNAFKNTIDVQFIRDLNIEISCWTIMWLATHSKCETVKKFDFQEISNYRDIPEDVAVEDSKNMDDPQLLYISKYCINISSDLLGKGGYGEVYRGTYASNPFYLYLACLNRSLPVAIKQYYGTRLPALVEAQIENEIHILMNLSSEYIVNFKGAFLVPGRPPALVMEYCAGGNLYQWLYSIKRRTLSIRFSVIRDILEGVLYLHKMNIVHQDLKPENILITMDERAKITDFGVSRLRENSTTTTNLRLNDRLYGTVRYMAPELIQGEKPSRASDIWAVGLILFEITFIKRPYEGIHDEIILVAKIKSGYSQEIPEECSLGCQALGSIMRRCWLERTKRPNVNSLVEEIAAVEALVDADEENDAVGSAATTVQPVQQTTDSGVTPSYNPYIENAAVQPAQVNAGPDVTPSYNPYR